MTRKASIPMPLVYVTMQPTLESPPGRTLYGLLLPRRGKWPELEVRASAQAGAGFGVYPSNPKTSCLKWGDLGGVPVLLPYLGLETVVQDHHTMKLVLDVLRGDFVTVQAGEVVARVGKPMYRDGLCAISTPVRSEKPLEALDSDTELLQVSLRPALSAPSPQPPPHDTYPRVALSSDF